MRAFDPYKHLPIFSILLDVIQVRTLWLREGSDVIAAVFTASLAAKILVFLLEVREKRNILVPKYKNYSHQWNFEQKPIFLGEQTLFSRLWQSP